MKKEVLVKGQMNLGKSRGKNLINKKIRIFLLWGIFLVLVFAGEVESWEGSGQNANATRKAGTETPWIAYNDSDGGKCPQDKFIYIVDTLGKFKCAEYWFESTGSGTTSKL